MASYSDNLLVSMEDQSNTYNNIDTHEVLKVTNSRSEMNPEFQQVTRMTSVPETDGETCTVASITEKMETVLDLDDGKDITDAVILHAEDDKQLVSEFIQNIETEFPELQLNLKIFEQLNIGKGILESASLLFRTCRFVFVFMTKIFKQDDL
ncbi:unnamed protein product [Mytilus coruscus]|uniref:Uncharacterized protein n=1 Tax=Mytilus coruscus TaxID=42192 RepID=A0A6J8D888_MYTCO|nr:unnamed protein product [Mytilus coruscus]